MSIILWLFVGFLVYIGISIITKEMRLEKRLPFSKTNKQKRVRELEDYLIKFPEQKELTEMIGEYLSLDFRFDEEGMLFGRCDEIREWERITSKQKQKDIRELAQKIGMNDKQLDDLVAKVILTETEYFSASSYSHPQERLTKSYWDIQRGEYSYFERLSGNFKKQST